MDIFDEQNDSLTTFFITDSIDSEYPFSIKIRIDKRKRDEAGDIFE